MDGIYKFEKTFLGEGDIRVNRKKGDTSFYTHRHDYYEILLYRGCDGTCHVNGKEYSITESCLFLLTPGDFHRIDAHNNEAAESIVVSFSESVADRELLTKLAFSPRVWYGPSSCLIQLMEALHDSYLHPREGHEIRQYHILGVILCDILENSQSILSESRCISPAVSRVMTEVLTDVSADISLAGVAASCGMTPSYFSDLFHRETGKRFKEWLNSVRVEYAKRLLEEKEMLILEVGYECGYNTPSQFIKMFKRETGVTPSAYRIGQRS